MSAFIAQITEFAAEFEPHFKRFLPPPEGLTAQVDEAMRYAALGGGKRLRPFLIVKTAELFGAPEEPVWRLACAMEAIHVYSLVHDDLPCMDDDDLRRGKPTVHKAWDEATAVLAGDGLQTRAFEVLTRPMDGIDPARQLAVISAFAKAAGTDGMVGGQMIDLSMDRLPQTEETITALQHKKTGALIRASVLCAAQLCGADEAQTTALQSYSENLGLLFQITDDILDVEGDAELMGKAVGKDDGHGKATFVTIFGLDGAKQKASELAEEAHKSLAGFGRGASPLLSAIDFVLERKQ